MKHLNIKLERYSEVIDFYNKVCRYDGLLLSQDNKSIPNNFLTGVLVLDIDKPITLMFSGKDTNTIENIANDFEKWAI